MSDLLLGITIRLFVTSIYCAARCARMAARLELIEHGNIRTSNHIFAIGRTAEILGNAYQE